MTEINEKALEAASNALSLAMTTEMDRCGRDGGHINEATLARAAIAAYEAALWQPIESAPRDGTRLIVGNPQGGVNIAFWRDAKGGQWFCYDMPGFWYEGVTHWRPLPTPPKGDE